MSDMIRKSDALAAAQDASDNSDEPQDVVSAIAALPAVTVGVKPLVWRSNGKGRICADTPFGLYEVEHGRYGMRLLHSGSFMQDDLQGIDAAKAAAQADYEARILAALEPVAAPVTQDKFSAVDHMSRVADTWMHKAEGLQREIDMLTDPVVVHANMLRGSIAKPTVEQIVHLYGVDALTAALAPMIVREAAPYMTDLMVDPEEIPDMEMEYDHRAGASDDE